MLDLSKHPYFKPWRDPKTEALSYILTEHVAPIQFPVYFTNSSFSHNGQFLCFYAAFPPAPALFVFAIRVRFGVSP